MICMHLAVLVRTYPVVNGTEPWRAPRALRLLLLMVPVGMCMGQRVESDSVKSVVFEEPEPEPVPVPELSIDKSYLVGNPLNNANYPAT